MLSDFKKFLFQGNVLDLAIAVVVGVAFKAIIDSLVANILMPIIAVVIGKPSFDDLTLTIHKGVIYYGKFLTSVVNFVIIAAALFVIIQTFEKLQARRKTGEEPAPDPTDEVILLTEIRDALQKG